MRRSAPWLFPLDERILEHLDEESMASPWLMSLEMRTLASEGRIRERCGLLADAGLIGPVNEGSDWYELTTSGSLYLDGQLTAEIESLPAPGPVRVGPPPERRRVRG